MTASDSAGVPTSWKRRAISSFMSLVTLAGLISIGGIGHSTHWTFGLGTHDEDHAEAGHTTEHAVAAAGSAGGAKNHFGDVARNEPVDDQANESTSQVKFDSPEAVRDSGIEIVPLEERSIGEIVRANGMIDFDQHHLARVSGLVSGKVWRVEKRLGDAVKKGDVLALIESVQVGEAKSRFLSALAVNQSREETVRILESVSNLIAQRQLREARLTAQESRIELLNSEQVLLNLGLKLSIDEFAGLSDIERVARIRFLGLPETIVKEIRSDQSTSNLIPLTAPFDGVVIGRDVGLGEVVEPARPLFEIADISKMWIVLNVRKEDAYKLRIGQKFRFQGDGTKEPVESTLVWIASEVDQVKRTLEVRGEIPNHPRIAGSSDGSEYSLRARTFGVATIEVGGRTSALVAAREAVHDDGDKRYVFVKSDDRTFQAVQIETGLEDSAGIEILTELPRTSQVAGRGSHILKSQMSLRKIETGEP